MKPSVSYWKLEQRVENSNSIWKNKSFVNSSRHSINNSLVISPQQHPAFLTMQSKFDNDENWPPRMLNTYILTEGSTAWETNFGTGRQLTKQSSNLN